LKRVLFVCIENAGRSQILLLPHLLVRIEARGHERENPKIIKARGSTCPAASSKSIGICGMTFC